MVRRDFATDSITCVYVESFGMTTISLLRIIHLPVAPMVNFRSFSGRIRAIVISRLTDVLDT